MKRALGAVIGLVAAAALAAADASPGARELMKHAREAYARGDRATFLRDYQEVARLKPGDVWVLYNLACAEALNGRTAEALAALSGIAARRVAMDLEGEKDFDSIRQTEEFRRIAAAMAALRKERVSSGAAVAFTIPEKGLAPEGVAYDPLTKAFFVASVNRGEIFRVGADGKVSTFVGASAGIRSALGIAADAKRRTLWVASGTLPNMNGGKDGDPPDSALLGYDLDTGKPRGRYLPAASGEPPHFDDLTVAASGRVYVNDGFHPRVFTLAPGSGHLAPWLELADVAGTQGLAPTPDGRTLYVSDYRGLYRVDVATKRSTPLPVPADLALNGIDGLVYFDGSLVAIQNGIEPHRVIRLDLASDGVGIAKARILEMNHPAFDEPTLGVVVDGALYFTANHQGHRFEDAKHPPPAEELQDTVILRLPLR